MEESRFSEEQVIWILNQQEAGVKTADWCREHGRLRDECLNTSWFRTLNDLRNNLANWRREYNEDRPHNSLDYRTPDQSGAASAMQM